MYGYYYNDSEFCSNGCLIIYYTFEGGCYTMDKGIYCEAAEYDDNNYICRYTGKPCTVTPIPNKYQCHQYELEKSKSKN